MDIFEVIKNKIELPEYIARSTACELTEDGSGFKTNCPFPDHDDKTPSFSIFKKDDSWRYHCFGCTRSGDLFDFQEEYFGQTQKESITALAASAGIDLDEYNKKVRTPKLSTEDEVRELVQRYVRKTLKDNEYATNYLRSRGITKEIEEKWQIGLSDGEIFNNLREEVRTIHKLPNNDVFLQIGIAIDKKQNGNVKNYISSGKLMFPVYYKNRISHWRLRNVDGKSGGYQFRKETILEGCLFYNQDALRHKEFWIVEGEIDTIMLEEAGKHAVGMMGPSRKKTQFLCNLKQIDDLDPKTSPKITIHICFDNDDNASGNKKAVEMARELAKYHTVYLYTMPTVEEDIADHLRKGKPLSDIERITARPAQTKIRVADNKYWTRKKNDEEWDLVPISNFIIKRKYAYITQDKEIRYQVHINGDEGERVGLVPFDACDYSYVTRFVEWLGHKGDFIFEGTPADLIEIRKYWKYHESPRQILNLDEYGNVKKGLWLADNGVIHNGKVIYSNKDGVTELKAYGVDGIKVLHPGSDEVAFRIPKTYFSVEEIITYLWKFWGHQPSYVLKMIGLASMCYHHNKIREKYKQIPVASFFGGSLQGKTMCAAAIAGLVGAGNLGDPSKGSTSKGIERMLATCFGLPIISNESNIKYIGDLVRAVYDRSPSIRAKTTNTKEIHSMQKNTTLFITSENIPKEASVINRTIQMDFFKFHKDQSLAGEFKAYEHNAILLNKNIGFLIALAGTNAHERIIEDIEKTHKDLREANKKADARQVYNYAVLYGSMRNAFRHLGITAILRKIGVDPPENDDILKDFDETTLFTEGVKEYDDPLRHFFIMLEMLYAGGHIDKYIDVFDNDYIRLSFKTLWPIVRKHDRQADDKLRNTSLNDIYNMMRARQLPTEKSSWRVENEEGLKYTTSCYKIKIDDLRRKLGVTFETKLPDYVKGKEDYYD